MAVDVQKWFNEDFGAGLGRHADEARKVDGKFHVVITGEDGGDWWVDPSAGKVVQGDLGGANLTITMNSSTFAKFHDDPRGTLMQGFFAGRIHLVGDQMAGEKFARLTELAKQ
ncbi:SCP2 sterol-binding domain-containing protein [Streptomyces sp. DH10]|uniref:SCP2 sterol-binding domain-containing protein n=1 Tax=Streptomyces sp. DH10 TaxID=3040121 RepID=UPI002440F714|nr:SCP2 sterol-binding domain-containing protein [Streptomyces sp. DH10]MDG9710598.1 SCP2 sterol-binding domain-containing protein [Streptomyces sp. DH10]